MLYLSEVIGRPVRDRNDERIGKISDLIVAVEDQYPPVTGLVMETGRRPIFLPWHAVSSLDSTAARLATARIDIEKFQQRPNEILLRADLMDKQIVDIDGRKVVRVNDLRLDEVDGRLRLVAVDVGAAGLVRRLGFERGFRVLARNLRVSVPERYIDWKDVDPVESSIASIKLRVPHRGSPSSTRPTSRRSSTDSRRATGRASSPRSTTRRSPTQWRRWSRTPRSRSSRTWPRSGPPTSSRR